MGQSLLESFFSQRHRNKIGTPKTSERGTSHSREEMLCQVGPGWVAPWGRGSSRLLGVGRPQGGGGHPTPMPREQATGCLHGCASNHKTFFLHIQASSVFPHTGGKGAPAHDLPGWALQPPPVLRNTCHYAGGF